LEARKFPAFPNKSGAICDKTNKNVPIGNQKGKPFYFTISKLTFLSITFAFTRSEYNTPHFMYTRQTARHILHSAIANRCEQNVTRRPT
jgi:hypothetical protein